MKSTRVALAQIGPALGDLERNLAQHLDSADQASRDGARVVVFPELSLSGYLLRDQVPEVALTRDHPLLERLANASRSIDIVVGFVEESRDHRYYNAAGYFSGGGLSHVHRKLYLPTYGMLDEARDFAAGHVLRPFESSRGMAGILVCEDLWHTTSPWLLAHEGAEVVYTVSSSPTRGTRPGREVTTVAVWRQLLQVTAQFATLFMVYVNRVGCEDGLTFGGGSMVIDPFGRVVAEMPALEEGLSLVDLDAEALRRARTAYPLLRDERLDLVHRELERIRRRRYELPSGQDDHDGPDRSDRGPEADGRNKR